MRALVLMTTTLCACAASTQAVSPTPQPNRWATRAECEKLVDHLVAIVQLDQEHADPGAVHGARAEPGEGPRDGRQVHDHRQQGRLRLPDGRARHVLRRPVHLDGRRQSPRPPPTIRLEPVVYADSSERNQSAAAAVSSTVRNRAGGDVLQRGREVVRVQAEPESTKPGETALTVTPFGASRFASVRTEPEDADLREVVRGDAGLRDHANRRSPSRTRRCGPSRRRSSAARRAAPGRRSCRGCSRTSRANPPASRRARRCGGTGPRSARTRRAGRATP